MAILREWDLQIDADDVLRGQGADPEGVRARSPRLIAVAERAIEDGLPLVQPAVLYREMKVEALLHRRLLLAAGATLNGLLIAQHLGGAERVVVVLCTIGRALETYASQVMASDGVYGLALDGVGSAAVEALATAACRHFAAEAAAEGMRTTVPLNPGMVGWPVPEGQAQIFAILDGSEIGVTLTADHLMMPIKSLSMVIGVGLQVDTQGRPCDFCTMAEVCRYRSCDG